MKLFAHIGRFAALVLLGPALRAPDGELAAVEGWIDEEQWGAGIPRLGCEPVGWRWWRGQ